MRPMRLRGSAYAHQEIGVPGNANLPIGVAFPFARRAREGAAGEQARAQLGCKTL
jgi:hypothetical protein